jgi:hypothetical protein
VDDLSGTDGTIERTVSVSETNWSKRLFWLILIIAAVLLFKGDKGRPPPITLMKGTGQP